MDNLLTNGLNDRLLETMNMERLLPLMSGFPIAFVNRWLMLRFGLVYSYSKYGDQVPVVAGAEQERVFKIATH